jgi:LacI family transcriptional regulator
MTKSVTLKHIATEVNKTVVTVSKALRDHPDVSKETREEIKRVASRLGYSPNLIARKLSSHRTRSLGLVVPHIAHPFFTESIEAIYEESHSRGYDIIMMLSGENDTLEAQHIQTLLSLQVDGFLISVSEKTRDKKPFQNILGKGKKLIFFDRVIEDLGCGYVVCDNYQGTYDLVSFAIRNGYTRIGYLAGYKEIYIGSERRRGFAAAMQDHHLEIRPEWIHEAGFDQHDGYDGFMKLHRAGHLPQLIATVSYPVALGVLQGIREVGLEITKDIDLITFGESEFNRFLNPSLTVSKFDSRGLGKSALNMLIEAVESDIQPVGHVVVPTQLVINETGIKPVQDNIKK